jgi:glutamate formiminotransferase
VAYNVNLATADLALARQIARTIRESSGGFPAVQALGMATADPEIVQVSTNLLDTAVTPLHVVFEAICGQAGAAGVEVVESEVVGLVPTDVLVATAARLIKAPALTRHYALEASFLDTLGDADVADDATRSVPAPDAGTA